MRILQVCGSLGADAGGIAVACAALANHLARSGADVAAVSVTTPGTPRVLPLDDAVEQVACTPWPSARFGYCRGLAEKLDGSAHADVVHLHGLWRLHYLQAARYAKRQRSPMLVSPHGMVHATALRQRGALKQIARVMFQDDVLRDAGCLHATAQEEVDEIRAYGYTGPVALVPWGIDAPTEPASRRRDTNSGVTFGYLGRFHPSKGLDALLRAWARASRPPTWRLMLAGFDERGYRATLESLVRELGVAESVTFREPVAGAAREAFFSAIDIAVLPSPAENFGLVVPEALVRGIPVIATRGTPWSALTDHRCGWWVAADDGALADAIAAAGTCDADTRRAMGDRGRGFAASQFNWRGVTDRLLTVYSWLLGRGARPSFVQVLA